MELGALSLANDALNYLPQYRKDYLNVVALLRAIDDLEDAHLSGGGASLKAVVGLKVRPAVRLNKGVEEIINLEKGLSGRQLTGSGASEGEEQQGETQMLLAAGPAAKVNYSSAAPSTHSAEPAEDDPEDIKMFVERFVAEVSRVERVYTRELELLEERYGKLAQFCKRVIENKGKDGLWLKSEELSPEFEVLYRKAHHLENFALTNSSICSTLLNHRKVSGRRWGTGWLGRRLTENALALRRFAKADDVRFLESRICKQFSDYFCEGNDQIAKFRLLRKKREEIDWQTIKVGMWVGAALMGLLLCIYAIMENPNALFVSSDAPNAQIHVSPLSGAIKDGGLRIFRVGGLLLLMGVGFCFQMVAWREARVNVPVIFGIPAALFPSTAALFLRAARFTVAYLICFVLFVSTGGTTAMLMPVLVLAGITYIWFSIWYYTSYKLQLASGKKRKSGMVSFALAHAKGTALFAMGLTDNCFFTAYVTDYLTSSSKILVDLAMVGCNVVFPADRTLGYLSRLSTDSAVCLSSEGMSAVIFPVIMAWPLWLRVGQNLTRFYSTGKQFPFVLNACKYGMAHTVVIISSLHHDLFSGGEVVNISLFMFAFVLTSLFTFSWDVLIDWGLGDPGKGGLRKHLMYGYPTFYYASILADFVLRFMWTLQLVPKSTFRENIFLSTGFVTGLEVIRRTWWGLLRVENEMLSNTRHYKYSTSSAEQHFIPLYFESPFQAEQADGGSDAAPGEEKAREQKEVVAQIVLFLVVLIALALAAMYF